MTVPSPRQQFLDCCDTANVIPYEQQLLIELAIHSGDFW
jgi:hypothetical protein